MTSQRIDAPTGPTHIAEQELKHRSGADYLSAIGMLRPTNSVDDCRRLFHVAVLADGGEEIGSLDELILRNSGDAFHHLRGVARILLFQKLEDRTRMLQRKVICDVRRKHRGRLCSSLRRGADRTSRLMSSSSCFSSLRRRGWS